MGRLAGSEGRLLTSRGVKPHAGRGGYQRWAAGWWVSGSVSARGLGGELEPHNQLSVQRGPASDSPSGLPLFAHACFL